MLSFVAMDYFKNSSVMAFPLIALGLFMLVFFVVTLRTVLTQKSRWDAIQRLPLEQPRTSAGDAHE